MASSVYSGEDEYLIGSDSADEIYKPVVLKAFKHGIDRPVTSIAFVRSEQIGYFVLVCYSNKQLAMFNENGDFRKNSGLCCLLQSDDKYIIHDISRFIGVQMVFTVHSKNKGSSFHSYIPFEKDIEPSGDFAVIPDDSLKGTMGHIITGICLLESEKTKDGFSRETISSTLAVCYVDALSYETTPNSRRYVIECSCHYCKTSHLKPEYYLPSQNTNHPNTLIEFKDKDKKERYFTFPKRITVSNHGDKWIIDRKSPSCGDVKVFEKQSRQAAPLLKFVYRGNPGSTFDPMDIQTSEDVMVISDCCNHNVHLVKNDGTFLMHVMTGGQGLQYPRALCVDVFDRIWVSCNDGTVHILKYRTEFEA